MSGADWILALAMGVWLALREALHQWRRHRRSR